MPKPEDASLFRDEGKVREQLQWLILGRFALVFLLLLASWWWTGSYLEQTTGSFPTGLLFFFLVVVGLTCIYHAAAYFDRRFDWQRRVQFFIDVFLVTWLVWETGDVNSPYVSLYVVLICAAGFFLGKTDTLAISLLSAA